MGTRGSASTEYFLEKSYAVIFLYRKKTLQPFDRKFSNVSILDMIEYSNETHDQFKVADNKTPFTKTMFNKVFDDYARAKEKNLLLKIDYMNLVEYLCLLEYTCKQINVLENKALVYLAAAVSDFYLPKNEMPKHKIQSSTTDGLHVSLKPVPKLLGKIRAEWCPKAFIISFKLETDITLLNTKCKTSLEKYKQDVVIGNILEDRKNKVSCMQANGQLDDIVMNNEKGSVQEIEELIISYLIDLHLKFKSQ